MCAAAAARCQSQLVALFAQRVQELQLCLATRLHTCACWPRIQPVMSPKGAAGGPYCLQVQRTRELQRGSSRRAGKAVVAVIGYTNAGKSSLAQALSKRHMGVQDK